MTSVAKPARSPGERWPSLSLFPPDEAEVEPPSGLEMAPQVLGIAQNRLGDGIRHVGVAGERESFARPSARFGQERQLLASRFAELIDKSGRVVAGEAMVGELRLPWVASRIAHRAINALD